MTHLRRYLEQTAAIAPEQLDAALRRQQIYGGSLDTVLLELSICDAQTLCELLGQACGLDVVTPDLLAQTNRPWSAVPSSLVEIGWATPLGVDGERILVGVHPDLPNERLGELYRSVDRLVPLVTPECCIEKINAEHGGSVVPQRYAVLYAAFSTSLRRRDSISDVGFPILDGQPPQEDTATGPPPPAVPAADPPEDPLDHPPAADRITEQYGSGPSKQATKVVRPPSFGPPRSRAEDAADAWPVDDDDVATAAQVDTPQPVAPGAHTTPADADPPEPTADESATDHANADEPPASESAAQEPAAEDANASPQDMPREDVAESKPPRAKAPPVRFSARGTLLSTSGPPPKEFDAEHARAQIALATERLSGANSRQDVVEMLSAGALAVSQRVAVFRIKGADLIGLSSPTPAFAHVSGSKVSLEGTSVDLDASQRWAGTTAHGGLSEVIGERDLPCTLHRIDVAGRPVLALYVDHGGREFLPAEANLLDELCESTSHALESIVRQRSGPSQTAHPREVSKPSPLPAPPETNAVEPPTSAPEAPAASTPTSSAREEPPAHDVPPAYHGEPHTHDTPTPHVTPAPKVTTEPSPSAQPRPAVQAVQDEPSPAPETTARFDPPTPAQPDDPREFVVDQATPSRTSTRPPLGDPPGVMPPPAFGITKPPGWGPTPDPVQREVVEPDDGAPSESMQRDTLLDGSAPTRAAVPSASEHPAGPPPAPRFVPPPLDAVDDAGIIPLASPISQPSVSARGRIMIDDEELAAEPKSAEVDLGEQRAVRGLLDALARKEADVEDIRQLGDPAMRALAQSLPGPLEVLRRDLRALPPPSAHGPFIRAVIRLGNAIVPHLLVAFANHDPDVRFYASFVFQELRDPRAMEPLSHLGFDSSTDVRVIAMRVLETYSRYEGYERATTVVRAELQSEQRTRQLYAARAVGTLRDVDAIPELVDLLSSRDRFIQEAALESLCSITGQQHGLKPHRWKSWYTEHGQHHRVEWIIDSLRHRDVPVRRWAHDELVRVTGHRVPFSPMGDRKAREVAHQAWRQWWDRHGRTRLNMRVGGHLGA